VVQEFGAAAAAAAPNSCTTYIFWESIAISIFFSARAEDCEIVPWMQVMARGLTWSQKTTDVADFIAFRPLGFLAPPIHMLPAKHSAFSMALPGQASDDGLAILVPDEGEKPGVYPCTQTFLPANPSIPVPLPPHRHPSCQSTPLAHSQQSPRASAWYSLLRVGRRATLRPQRAR